MQLDSPPNLDWTSDFTTQKACIEILKRHRWPDGFICPRCEHNHAYVLKCRILHQCANCRHQVSITAGTIFQGSKTPLSKWFLTIYLMSAANEADLTPTRLSKLVGISWRSARSMLHKLRNAMNDPQQAHLLHALSQIDANAIRDPQSDKRD